MSSAMQPTDMEGLVDVVQRLSMARDLPTVQDIVRRAARQLTGADGATFVLREGEHCFYADEDAITPLWKGQRFPISACISGWSMLNRRPAVIEDIYADDRVPHNAYRPTFVKSLVMVPIRTLDPIGAIGNYWARRHRATDAEVKLLGALADTTAVALENVRVFTELEERVNARTAALQEANRQLEESNRELRAAHQQSDRVFRAYAKALPGTILDGKYRLDDELGYGGFGVVFRGWHMILDNPIAIKVFRPSPGNDSSQDLQRFLREGAAAARLAHPNAVRVYDSGVSGEGIAYLIMELLNGQSLAAEMVRRGPPSLRRCALIAATVADVLAAAHQQGIIHRDIKPGNVFIHKGDAGEVIKVVDFGVARFFGNALSGRGEQLTQPGELLGTPNFFAPERIAGGPDDGRSDVYSLGITLYQMICNDMPWPAHQRSWWGMPQELPPIAMSERRRGVPAELEDFVKRMIAWEAGGRPTAQEAAMILMRMAERLDDGPADLVFPPSVDLVLNPGSTAKRAVN